MHCSSFVSAFTLLATASAYLVEAGSHQGAAGLSLRSPGAHRRHHHSGSIKRKRATKCRASSSSSSSTTSGSDSDSSASTSTSGNSASTNSTTSSGSTLSVSSAFLSKNGLPWGYLPDEADAGGTKQTMAQLNAMTNTKSAFYGYYAQARSGTTFDGSQLLAVIDDVKASGAIFQPAVMPTGGWQGLTSSDNSQAVAIANVMKKFTDEGIEVWLRFAHEVNWYLTDGTYSGSLSDFKEGWKTMAAAIDEIAPDVKMFFTPNVANAAQYEQYYPTEGRVDVIGIDYYPSKAGSFVSTMQTFHDAHPDVKFAIGETGLSQTASMEARLAYVEEITSEATMQALPNFIGCTWFNFLKGGVDFRILGAGDDSATAAFFAS